MKTFHANTCQPNPRTQIWPMVLTLMLALNLICAGMALCDTAGEMSRQAIQLQKDGRLSEALELLTAALEDQQAQEPDSAYRGRLYYTLGYVCEQQADVEAERRKTLFEMSARYYKAVLKCIPDHGPTLHALALIHVRNSNPDSALTLLDQARSHDPARAGHYLLASGEIHQRAHRWSEALADFQQAATLMPDHAAPRRRMVEALAELPIGQAEQMLDVIELWEEHFPEVARQAYEAIIVGACKSRERLAVRAMMSWTRLMADKDWITSGNLSFLPPGCMSAARDGLLEYLESPEQSPGYSSWWMKGYTRKLILVRVALALGKRELAAGRPEQAERIWTTAGEFRDMPSDKLIVELAVLYSNYRKSLDPQGMKRHALLRQTYSQKGEAYAQGNLEDIERYHTILALIFSVEKNWGNSYDSMSAIFQLEHALDIAADRNEESGEYRPLAGLKMRLAEGLAATNHVVRACEQYLEAAMAYLDLDDLTSARQALAEGSRDAAADTRRKAEHLKSLVQCRRILAEDNLRPERVDELYHKNRAQLTGMAESGAFREEFLQRQEFKILADIATGSSARISLDCASRAFDLAASGQTTLTGIGDLFRLERVLDEVATSFRIEGGLQVRNPNSASPASGRTVKFSLPGAGRSKVVALSSEAVLAGRIRKSLGPEAMIILDIRGDTVDLLQVEDGESPDNVADRIRQVDGVKRVIKR